MTKKEKVTFILATLNRFYPQPQKPLMHKDPYTLLIAVLLSAQCTDKRVNQVTPILFRMASTPQEMVRNSVAQIKSIIKPCGLFNNKAKHIHALSMQLIKRHNGIVPETFEDLEALDGVGHKTASVVMIQAFGKAAFPVDTHIHRLMKRWGLSKGKNVVQTEEGCKRLFPQELWHKLHLQIIFFGREYCRARGHRAAECPICSVLKNNLTLPI